MPKADTAAYRANFVLFNQVTEDQQIAYAFPVLVRTFGGSPLFLI